MNKVILSCTAFLLALVSQAQSIQPSVVNVSGGWIQNSISTIMVEWSLGEPAINTISDTSMVTQGVLQPYIVGAVDLFAGEQIILYPNPVKDHLFIKTSTNRIANLTFIDLLGRKVLEDVFAPDIGLGQLPSGVYFLELLDSRSRLLSTYKIIKI